MGTSKNEQIISAYQRVLNRQFWGFESELPYKKEEIAFALLDKLDRRDLDNATRGEVKTQVVHLFNFIPQIDKYQKFIWINSLGQWTAEGKSSEEILKLGQTLQQALARFPSQDELM